MLLTLYTGNIYTGIFSCIEIVDVPGRLVNASVVKIDGRGNPVSEQVLQRLSVAFPAAVSVLWEA